MSLNHNISFFLFFLKSEKKTKKKQHLDRMQQVSNELFCKSSSISRNRIIKTSMKLTGLDMKALTSHSNLKPWYHKPGPMVHLSWRTCVEHHSCHCYKDAFIHATVLLQFYCSLYLRKHFRLVKNHPVGMIHLLIIWRLLNVLL